MCDHTIEVIFYCIMWGYFKELKQIPKKLIIFHVVIKCHWLHRCRICFEPKGSCLHHFQIAAQRWWRCGQVFYQQIEHAVQSTISCVTRGVQSVTASQNGPRSPYSWCDLEIPSHSLQPDWKPRAWVCVMSVRGVKPLWTWCETSGQKHCGFSSWVLTGIEMMALQLRCSWNDGACDIWRCRKIKWILLLTGMQACDRCGSDAC